MAAGTSCVLHATAMYGGNGGGRYLGATHLIIVSVIAEVVMGKRANRARCSPWGEKVGHYHSKKKRQKKREEYRRKMTDTERKAQDERILAMAREIEQAQY